MERPGRVEYTPREAAIAANGAGVVLVAVALSGIPSLWYPQYAHALAYLPLPVLWLRYAVSCMVRMLAVAAGLGVLARREWARRLAIGVELFTIATLWWKHPARAIARLLAPAAPLSTPEFLAGFRWFLYAADGLVAAAVIYALTRAKVRERFSRS